MAAIDSLKEISMKNTIFNFDWQFHVEDIKGGHLVQVSFVRPDTESGVVTRGYSRKEYVADGTTISGIVKTGWLLIELTIRHELMESFRWKNCRIFNPHHSVHALASLEHIHNAAFTLDDAMIQDLRKVAPTELVSLQKSMVDIAAGRVIGNDEKELGT